MDRIYILAAAILLAGFLSGGIYTAAGNGASGGTKVLNRFTGGLWDCDHNTCTPVRY